MSAIYRRFAALALAGLIAGACGCGGEAKTHEGVEKSTSAVEIVKTKPVDVKGKGIDPADPSIVYDEPFVMVSRFKIYNGKAYDKAALWVEAGAKIVLPDKATVVEHHDDANVVLIYMEKRMNFGFHVRHDVNIVAEKRPEMGCVAKLEKGALMFGSFGEISFYEGSRSMRFVFVVPHKAEVVRRVGLVGGPGGRDGSVRPAELITPAEKDPKPPLDKKKEGRPECWLPPLVEDGWHEVPAIADDERRAAKR